ncbi:retinoid-inducible serine carboxypeptidase-like [Tubulanus polymorphus]|uniref:retinoid-inducible serine carboxypeptidase-like n=1 Tax=Tubulanus polymorphus TaxID=672921 RepID=UPI003DA662A7
MIESKDNPAFVADISTDSSDIKLSVTPTPETKPQKTDNSSCSPRCRTVFLVFLSFIAVSYAIAITIVLIHEVYFSDEGEHGIQQKQFTAYEVLANTARGYIDVRKGAHMFWWLWYAIPKHTYKEKPLILWIQGGPGQSGVGIGGFMEIGPYDTDLKYRKGNWAVHANLLIVDSPVGVGYSYVDNESLNTKNTDEIIADLMSFLKQFFNKHPEFKTIPFHIFGESYGGRIAPLLAKQLHNEITGGNMECLLKGIVLGGPAVDVMTGPVATWAQYLYTMSIIEESKKDEYEREYQKLMVTYQTKNYTAISEEFQKLSQIPYGTGIDMYNVLTWNTFEGE